MDTLTERIFKVVDSKKESKNNFKPKAAKKIPRPQNYPKSHFQIMQETLQSLEWKPELPPENKAFIPKGWRKATLRWLGFALKNSGIDRGIIEVVIIQAAKEICLPSISEKNAKYIVEGVFKKSSNGNGQITESTL